MDTFFVTIISLLRQLTSRCKPSHSEPRLQPYQRITYHNGYPKLRHSKQPRIVFPNSTTSTQTPPKPRNPRTEPLSLPTQVQPIPQRPQRAPKTNLLPNRPTKDQLGNLAPGRKTPRHIRRLVAEPQTQQGLLARLLQHLDVIVGGRCQMGHSSLAHLSSRGT